MNPRVRNPQAEADALVGDGWTARVLEPSPPAINTDPWFADDPASPDGAQSKVVTGKLRRIIRRMIRAASPDGAQSKVVTPTSAGDATWADLAADNEDIARFCQERWLANRKPLSALPDNFPVRRDDLHRLAYGVVSNARKAANGKFGLRWTQGGFGTPFYGDDIQVRVESRALVIQHQDEVTWQPITTLRAAAEFLGVEATSDQAEHDTVALGDLDRPLTVDEELVAFVGDWFGLTTAVAEELRCTPGAANPSRVQLWPGHFDIAIEVGDADAEPVTRATYGASLGDADHPEPYLYVGPWGPVDSNDPFWNNSVFGGASLPYSALLAATDPYTTALDFYRQAHTRINQSQ